MELFLKWKKDNNVFILGKLEKIDNKYIFTINEDMLKQAIKNGCMGIGTFDLLKDRYESENLFEFFANRIPSKNSIKINEILEKYNLKEYDEMELLRKTKAKFATDNYYVEE